MVTSPAAPAVPTAAPPIAGSARLFLGLVSLLAVAAALPALLAGGVNARDLATFCFLAAAAATAQLLLLETGKNHGFPIAVAFLVAGVLLLPVGLLALLGIAQHAPDVFRGRTPWYIHAFNTANYTLDALAAWASAHAIADLSSVEGSARWALASLVACVVFVSLNHARLATMLRLARGHSLRASQLFSIESLSIDFALAGTGVAVAALANVNLILVLLALAPLPLAHRLFRLMARSSIPQTAS